MGAAPFECREVFLERDVEAEGREPSVEKYLLALVLELRREVLGAAGLSSQSPAF